MDDQDPGSTLDETIDGTIDEIVESLNSNALDAAMAACRRALSLIPDYPPAIYLMGMLANQSGDLGLAIDLVTRAHELDPECRDFVAMLAVLEANAGRLSDSLYHAKLAIALQPHPRHRNLVPDDLPTGAQVFEEVGLSRHRLIGEMALEEGRFDRAIHEGEIELRLNPENLEAMILVARAQLAIGRLDPALDHLHAAIHLMPRSATVQRWLGELLLAAGRHDEALAAHRQAVALDPDDTGIAIQTLNAVRWQDDANYLAAQPLAAKLRQEIETARKPRRVQPNGAGQIGIIWDQCHSGPLMNFLLPTLPELKGSVIFYRVNRRGDIGTEAVRTSVLRFVDVVDLDAMTVERIIAGDGPEVLINLCGAAPQGRFPLFGGSPAIPRLQWLGLPLADRLPAIDAVIGSAETADIDGREFGPDRIVTVPNLLTWRFPVTGVAEEQVGPLPRDREGTVTFGAVGDMRRIGPETASLWAGALLAVPNSRLVLAASGEWPATVTRRLFELFANFGVSNRIELQPLPKETANKGGAVNLDFYARIDVFLDSAPVSSMAELPEALWMGVPAVTLRGSRRAGRAGAAILAAAGRAEWVADDQAAFAAKAAELATSPELAALRAGLRDGLAESPLCDAAGFGSAFKQAVLAFARGFAPEEPA